MKRDFQRATTTVATFVLVGSVSFLSACAPQKTVSSTYQKDLSDDCTSNALPQQFMVRFEDGSVGVIKAASEQDFLDNYLAANLKRVKYAEPDYRVHAAMMPVKTLSTPTTNEADNWGVMRVVPDSLWQQNVRGQGVIVAIVDSGMDYTHPQLASQVLVNSGEIAGNGIDDDSNGFIDDVYGWDFVNKQPLKGDNTYHGTHVSGIIGAAHSDMTAAATTHVEGMAPGAKLLPVAFLDADGSGAMSDGVMAIQYAVQRGAKVINASWGGTQCSRTLRDEVAALEGQGVIIVVAAGNESLDVDTQPEYPASLNLAAQITVGATGDHDYMADYSNYGAQSVHIFAPGSDIVSTLPGGKMGSLSGTSMATPFVTGAVALLLSAEPTATVAQIRQALYDTAIKRTDYINVSTGRLNLASTLADLRHLMGK